MEEFVEVKTVRLQRGGVSKSIELTVHTNSHDKPDICYIIDRKLPIRKLLVDYCKLRNIAYNAAVIYLFDGRRILPHKCADELEMEHGDIIEVFFDQMSGRPRESVDFEDIRRIKRMRYLNLGGFNSNEIKLRVQRQGKSDICYMLDRKCPFRKLFEDYCEMENFVNGTMRFLYDGTRLPADKCADDLEMEDGDIIDVFFDQISG